MISFKVERKWLCDEYTVGNFFFKLDGGEWQWMCNTMEDRVRDYNKDGKLDETKVYGETAIPYGNYKFIMAYSNTFKKELPLLLDVPGFTSIMIHPLTTAKQSKGCIGLGLNKEKGKILNSVASVEKLTKILNKNIQKEYNLIIT